MAGTDPQAARGGGGSGGQAHLLQRLSPVQIIVTVRGVVRLGGDAMQGSFQSCGQKGGHLQRGYPTRLCRESLSEPRAPWGLEYHRGFMSW